MAKIIEPSHVKCQVYTINQECRLVHVSKETMALFPHIRLGETCYTALRGEKNPCEDCPWRTREFEEERCVRKVVYIKRKLKELVYLNPLTGASSRGNFLQVLDGRFEELKKGAMFCVAMFDFDRFKDMNNSYGHRAGDVTLRAIVACINEKLPSGGMVGRYGGDEFMTLADSMNQQEFEVWANEIFVWLKILPELFIWKSMSLKLLACPF